MRSGALWTLVRRDLTRARGPLAQSGFGIAAGTAALVFFLALGLGVRAVLLGDVFPIDQVELEPPKAADTGLLGLIAGAGDPPGIPPGDIERLAAAPGTKAVYPKLRFAFPASARGGKEIFGFEVGTSEMIGDGIEPALVRGELPAGVEFDDPLSRPGRACRDTASCAQGQYCERASDAEEGRCSDPIPVLVSRYVVELFDKSIAPAHRLPPIGETLIGRAQNVTFDLRLGESLLGKAKRGTPRTVRARLVGISRRAIDLGITMPLEVVRRFNREYASERAAERFSSVVVEMRGGDAAGDVIAVGAALQLEPKDTRARDVSVLVSGAMALLSLVAGVILVVSASNIAYTFRVLVSERRAEIALYRALGAREADVAAWALALAALVGLAGGAAGVIVARLAALGADVLAARHVPSFPFKPDTFFAFPPWLLGAGVVFAACFAVVGAAGPARRAARVEPAQALSGG